MRRCPKTVTGQLWSHHDLHESKMHSDACGRGRAVLNQPDNHEPCARGFSSIGRIPTQHARELAGRYHREQRFCPTKRRVIVMTATLCLIVSHGYNASQRNAIAACHHQVSIAHHLRNSRLLQHSKAVTRVCPSPLARLSNNVWYNAALPLRDPRTPHLIETNVVYREYVR